MGVFFAFDGGFPPPLAEKRLDIIILELELVQASNVQEIVIFLTLLKPLEEQDKYMSFFKLGSMLVHPFLLKSSHPACQYSRANFLQGNCKFNIQTAEAFRIIKAPVVRISFDFADPFEGAIGITR